MKILLINDYGRLAGGAELHLYHLRDALRQRGHDVRLFASSARSVEGASFADYECLGTTSRFRTLLQTTNPWAYWRLRQTLQAFRPDVAHVMLFLTQLSPVILPLLRKVPTLYYAAWYRPVCPTGTKMWPDGTMCRVAWGSACYRHGCLPLRDWFPLMLQMRLWRRWQDSFNLIAANSSAVQGQLAAHGIEPVTILPHSVPVTEPGGTLTPHPTFVFAGRLVREKGVDVLVKAFKRVSEDVPEARLIIAGDGPEGLALQTLIGNLNLSSKIQMTGYLTQAEMQEAFAGAWVQVVPSRWEEPFGLVALEAMMRGMAVVATGTGGLAHLVQHEQTGYHVPPDDPQALANALLRLAQDRTLAETMGFEGRQSALHIYSNEAVVDRLLHLYDALLHPSA